MPSSSDVLIAGRYRLGDKIADGGMSTVWQAWDERLHRRVALKQLRLQAGLSEAESRLAADRAMREARITARLHHPNAVPVYDVVNDNGAPCLIMQYLPSKTLQALLAERSTLDVATVARIGAEIAAALAAAHQVGIVHRDVKPGNVLIDGDGAAKLTDFGISHALGDVTLTSTNMVTGTPAYLAPEAARGERAGFPADVFALGATLCTALDGAPPAGDSGNPIAVLHRVASGQFARPQPTTPLTTLLHRMLALDPAARPAMPDVAAELDRIAQHEGPAGKAATEPMATASGAGAGSGAPPSTTVVLPPARNTVRAGGPSQPPPVRPVPAAAAAAPPVSRPPARPASPPRRRRGPLVALAVVAALLLIGAVVLGVYLTRSGNGTPTASKSTTTRSPASARHSPSAHTSATTKPSSASSTHSTPTSSHSSTSSPATTTSSNADVSAIESYYALLPNDTHDAWQRLTANYQQNHANGRGNYEKFWRDYRSVTTSNVHPIGNSRVEADLTYTKTDGGVIHEVDDYTLVRQGGTLKIDQSDVPG